MTILFTGGGTMGPVTPLLAVYEALKKIDPAIEAIWIGTPNGPEREVVERNGIRFFDLPVARLPRSASLEWLMLPVRFLNACYKAAQIIRSQKPDVVASAGGYTAVPVILAAKFFSVRVWVHQQDAEVTLTTRLTAPFADRVTAAWERSLRNLPRKARRVGNPVRPSVLRGSSDRARALFGIRDELPTVLIFGGGTGARWMNEAIGVIAPELCARANVIHLTGKGKTIAGVDCQNYFVREFLDADMADALTLADVVVCRAGMGTLTELAALAKAAVVIPLPHSPQEANAREVEDACVVLDQSRVTTAGLLTTIVDLLDRPDRRKTLGLIMSSKLRTRIVDELAELVRGMVK